MLEGAVVNANASFHAGLLVNSGAVVDIQAARDAYYSPGPIRSLLKNPAVSAKMGQLPT
jgi:hypothetical protein